ncbi:unnamed protein product [Somion occarium]|uniref:F-box domain-containing protein n=1 Tax=Somion occarium TaxID=3059160 RepID=A0ABP1CHH3_9APHY
MGCVHSSTYEDTNVHREVDMVANEPPRSISQTMPSPYTGVLPAVSTPRFPIDSLPGEVISQFALHVPSVKDIISLSLTNHTIRNALYTPAIHKERVASRGWDVYGWNESLSDVALYECRVQMWQKIDWAHENLQRLLNKGINDILPALTLTLEACIGKVFTPPHEVLSWTINIMELAPLAFDDHRPNTRSRVMTGDSQKLWPVVFRALDLASQPSEFSISVQTDPFYSIHRTSLASVIPLHRALFHLVSLLSAQNLSVVRSLFGDMFETPYPKYHTFRRLKLPSTAAHSMRFSRSIMSLAILWVNLLLNPNLPTSIFSVRVPCHSQKPIAVGKWREVDGFPLNAMKDDARWVGYYSYNFNGSFRIDPPVHMSFNSVQWNSHQASFKATGADRVGSFDLNGTVLLDEGRVGAKKKYTDPDGPMWLWDGMVLPWGMVGTWGQGDGYGWWWIWPEQV